MSLAAQLSAVLALFLAAQAPSRNIAPTAPPSTGTPYGTGGSASLMRRAVAFEPNVGQFEPRVRYRADAAGLSLSLTDVAAEMSLGLEGAQRQVRMTPVGTSRRARPVALDRLAGVVNHFEGNTPSAWHARVPTFGRVRYAALYPGIDLVYHGSPDRLEYDFVVRRGADPARIAMRFDGADRVEIDPAGDLLIHIGDTVVRQRIPDAWQEHGRERRRVDARYRITAAGDVAFAIGAYDRRLPLVIDPILVYSSFLHASNPYVAVDAAGYVVIASELSSSFLGLKVERLSSDGQTSLYTSFVGRASDFLQVAGVGTAADGSAVVALSTSTPDLPLVNPSQAYPGDTGNSNGYVVKLDPSGGIVFSTYLGGTSSDAIHSVSVNAAGTVAVAGGTGSPDFPGIDGIVSGPAEGFITIFSPAGARLHGALLPTSIEDVVVDTAGSVYVAADTAHRNWPTTPTSFEPTPLEAICIDDSYYPCRQGVVAKFGADLRTLAYSTYLHTANMRSAGDLRVHGLAVDDAGSAYILGSGLFDATPGALFPQCVPNSFCVFVAKLNPAGSGLAYSTFLSCCASAMQVDGRGNVYLSGSVAPSLTSFAPTRHAQQPGPGDAQMFVTTDGGANWRPTQGVYSNSGPVTLVHTTGPVLYSVYWGSPASSLFTSTDLGAHWQPVDGNLWGLPVVVAGSPNTWYEGPSSRLLRRSIDGGATWALLPTPMDAWAFAVDAIDGQTLYIGGYQGGFKSVNGGYAWSPIAPIPGGSFGSLVVSPANRDLVFARNANGWFRSTNGGAQWTSVPLPYDESSFWLTFDPLDAMRIYANGSGSVLRSVDGGVSWTPFLNCFCAGLSVTHSPDLAVFVKSDQGLVRVPDTGTTVSTLPPPLLRNSRVWNLLADPVDPRIMIAVPSGTSDGFVSVLDPTGSQIRYASYFGGSDYDYISRSALGSRGTLALIGHAASRDLPLVNPRIPDRGGLVDDGFVALMRIPLPTAVLEAPGAGATTSPFTVAGWAIDTGAPSGPGIDAVHVWALPQTGGAAVFVGVAAYGAARPDIGTQFGAQFTNSGFSLTGASLPAGPYTLAAFAHSTVSGTFEATMRTVQVLAGGRMNVDAPAAGATLYQPFTISGWAIDAGAPSGTGIDTLHVWAILPSGVPRFVGVATYGTPRPDIGAAFGSRFTASGFTLQASGLPPGDVTLAIFARSLVSGTFDQVRTVRVRIPDGGAASIDLPRTGSSVSAPFAVAGWALDRQGAATGVDAVHVWAFPALGGSPIFLGVADAVSRPDVAAAYGDPRFELSGYALTVNALPPGTYTVATCARSVVTGTFSIVRTTQVTVLAGPTRR